MKTLMVAMVIPQILGACVDDVGTETSLATQPVIGGTRTPAGLYPATGALVAEVQGQRIVFCTGTLIAPDAVVTAAHCLLPPPQVGDFIPSFTLALDANNITAANLTRGRAKHSHPQFDGNAQPPGTLSREYDIGIVLLQAPVPNAQIAYLPTAAEAAALVQGMPLEITGYGQTNAADQDSVGVKFHATTTLAALGPYEIGVGVAGAAQNCHGDSGGPAYARFGTGLRMVGIVSRGNTGGEDSCDRGGIDTRADAYRQWLAGYTTLANPPADPPVDPPTPPGGDPPPGTPPTMDPDDPSGSGTASGGCAAGGAPGPAGALALLAFAFIRRRRR